MAQATLNGQVVNDGGLVCEGRFDWGATTGYGKTTAWQGGLTTGSLFNTTITGLAEGVLYHYRAVSRNAQGITYGNDVAFVTLQAAGMPVIIDDAILSRLLGVT